MDFPEEFVSKDFFKYMYKPIDENEDIYLELFLIFLWVVLIVIIVNIYLFFIRTYYLRKKVLDKQRYTANKPTKIKFSDNQNF